jgi:DNA repair exonuclease SbcCD ATPase subunit
MTQETEEQFVERRMREDNADNYRKEYQQSQGIARAKQEAQDAKEIAARTERLAQEKALEANAKSLRDVETCPVCGTEVAKTAIVHHIYNTEDRCIRKPRLCKASGIITEDAWDMLSDAEKKNGFVIKGGATLAAVSTLKKNTDNNLNPNAANCFGQKLL